MNTPENTDALRINPRISDVEIGIRNLRTIKIYPLSLAHEKKLTEKVGLVLGAMADTDADGGAAGLVALATFAMNVVMDNLEEFLAYAAPDENAQELMTNIDSQQAVEIAEVIYRVNYETIVKKVRELLGKIREIKTQDPNLEPIS